MKSLLCHSLWPLLLFLIFPNMALSHFGEKIGDEWEQVSPNIEFQRSADWTDQENGDGPMDEAMRRMLGGQGYSNSPYSYSMQSTGKEWNSYQLAWRLLGFYIDCNYKGDTSTCQRLVLYAVYVDPDYSGNGLSEYEFYDANSGQFVCHNYYGNCRAKMDCHLSGTSWQLMGIFKIASISAGNGWMEQLFKHEGVCVWGEDTYKFASKMRERIPSGCSKSKYTDKSGNYLYYDAKPEPNAKIGVGLYTDSKCSLEYEGSDVSVYTVTGYSEDYFDSFNDALDTWKICQPCVAYNLNYAYNNFYCYDEAGYENCNQCMKFSAKSYCETASQRDVTLAERQQTLVPFQMYGSSLGGGSYNGAASTSSVIRKATPVDTTSYEKSFPFMTCSMLFFMFSLIMFGLVGPWKFDVRKRRRRRKDKKRRSNNDDDDNNDGLVRDGGAVELPAVIASISRSFSNNGSEGAATQEAIEQSRNKSRNAADSISHNKDEPLIDFQLFNDASPSEMAISNKVGKKLVGIISSFSRSFSSKDNAEERSICSIKYDAAAAAVALTNSRDRKQPLLPETDIESSALQFDHGLAGTYGLDPPTYQPASTSMSVPPIEVTPPEVAAYEPTFVPTEEIKRDIEDNKAADEVLEADEEPVADISATFPSTIPDGKQSFSSSENVSSPQDEPPLVISEVPKVDDSSPSPVEFFPSQAMPDPSNVTYQPEEVAGASDKNSLEDALERKPCVVEELDGESCAVKEEEQQTAAKEVSSPVVDQTASTFDVIAANDLSIISIDRAISMRNDDFIKEKGAVPVADPKTSVHEDTSTKTSVHEATSNPVLLCDDQEAEELGKYEGLPAVDSESSENSAQGIDRYESLDNEEDSMPPFVSDGIVSSEAPDAAVDQEVTQSLMHGPERYASMDDAEEEQDGEIDVNQLPDSDPDAIMHLVENSECPSHVAHAPESQIQADLSNVSPRTARDPEGDRVIRTRSAVDPDGGALENPTDSDTFTFGSENCVDGEREGLNSNDDDAFLNDGAPFDELRDELLSDPISMDREAFTAIDDEYSDEGEVVGNSGQSSPDTGSKAASVATGIDNFLLDNDHFTTEGETPAGIVESISAVKSHVDAPGSIGVLTRASDDYEALAVLRDSADTTEPLAVDAEDPPNSEFVHEQPLSQKHSTHLLDDDDLSEVLGDEETVSSNYSSTELNVDPTTLATVSQFIDLVHQKSSDEHDLNIDETVSEVPDDEVLDKLGLLDIKNQFSGGAGQS